MSVTIKELRTRVKRGAHFLDWQTPKWAKEIDLASLNMIDGGACILGQVYGDYWGQIQRFGFSRTASINDYNPARSIRHGFTLAEKEYTSQNWSRLAELWAIEVAKRQVGSQR